MRIRKTKFFNKIFYSYLLIFTILIIVVELLVCSGIAQKNQTKEMNTETFFEENCSIMENKFVSIFQVIKLVSENEEVRSYAESSHNNYSELNFYTYVNIRDILSAYMASYLEVDCTMGISRLDDGIYVDNNNTKQLESVLIEKDVNHEQLIKSFENEEVSKNGALLILDSHSSFVSFVCKYAYSSGENLYYFVDFDKNYFLPAGSINQDEFFAIVSGREDGFCINRNAEDKQVKILEKCGEDLKAKRKTEKGIYTKPSDYLNDLIYVYYNPDSFSSLNYLSTTGFLLFLWVILMLVGVYISRNIAKRLYEPVSSVYNIIGDSYPGEHYDDILFLMNSVDNLVKDNKKLHEIANKNKLYLKHSFIKDLLTGGVEHYHVESGLQEYKLEYIAKDCLCVVCEIDSRKNTNTSMDYKEIQTLKGVFLGVAEEYLRCSIPCEVVSVEKNRFVIITKNLDEQILNKILCGLINESEEVYGFSLIMSVGKVVPNIYEINNSYMSALNLLEYRVVVREKQIIRAADFEKEGKSSYYYPVDVEKSLIYNVLEGNLKKCESILNNIFSVNFQELSLDKYNIKNFKFAIIATIRRILNQINKTEEDIFGENIVEYLEFNTAEEKDNIEKAVYKIIREIVKYVSDNSEEKKQEIVKNIINYIDENYHWDIALSDVAQHFSLSEGHIGRLLKNDLNTSFKKYLNERRIEVAKELLLDERNLSVNEVAATVGCNGAMTFIRMFKKHTGVSPGEYKRMQN